MFVSLGLSCSFLCHYLITFSKRSEIRDLQSCYRMLLEGIKIPEIIYLLKPMECLLRGKDKYFEKKKKEHSSELVV